MMTMMTTDAARGGVPKDARPRASPTVAAAASAAVSRTPGDGVRVARLVVRGPTAFVPEVGDRVHEHVWSGSNVAAAAEGVAADAAGATPAPGIARARNTFTVLRSGPKTWRVDVPCKNGAVARLIVRYALREPDGIDALLESGCADPIADLYGALEADLAALAGGVRACGDAPHDDTRADDDARADATRDEEGATTREDDDDAGLSTARGLATALAAPGALGALRARAHALGFELKGTPQVRAVVPSAAVAELRARAAKKRAAAAEAARARRRADVAATSESAEAERALEAAKQQHALAPEAARADAARAAARAADDDALRVLERLRALDVDLTQVLCTKAGGGAIGAGTTPTASAPVQAAITRATAALVSSSATSPPPPPPMSKVNV